MTLSSLKNIFTPPKLENDEKNHQAYLLHMILLGLIIVPIPYLLYTIIAAPEESSRALWQALIGEGINFSLLFLLKRGHVRTASIIQVIAFWFFFTISAATELGVLGESYLLGYPLVIMIAGLLLGERAALTATFMSLLAGLSFLYLARQGLLNTLPDRNPLSTWIVSLAVFPMSVVLQYLSSSTIRKALERARLSEEKYRLISKISSDYTFESEVDKHGKSQLIWVAGAFEKMTGYTLTEYLSEGGWFAHIHPDDLDKDAEDMQKLLTNQDVINSEIRTYTKDKELRWERIFAHPIWSNEENRLVSIIGAVQDITEQKLAEELLRETLLQQTAILNNIPDMAWLKDLDSRYIAVNEQYIKTCGLKAEDIVGKTDHEIWQKDIADIYQKDDLEVIQSGRRQILEEIQFDSTGREYWVETIKTPIRNSQGKIIGTTGISREITERKKAEIEREALIAELEAKNTELERFTYTVSHDLKSPLVTITGFLTYLESNARKGDFENFKKDLGRIEQAVEKMQNLLKDLLELSRIGRLMNEPVEIKFSEIIKEALMLTDGQIKKGNVSIEFSDDDHKVYGDRTRLVEVMQNLIDNAIKFMGNQSEPRIRIGTITDSQNSPTYYVQDNGIGIDTQYNERIFGLFNKLDTNSQGSGVGLTIVKRIIEVHGGRIWVESQPGAGTTFYFKLS